MAQEARLTITNGRITRFFAKRPHLDPEQTILSFVDIMERLADSVDGAVNSSLVEGLLGNIKAINERMSAIDSGIATLRSDTLAGFSQQMGDFKKEYVDNLRLSLTSNVSDKIEPLIKEQLQLLLERTSTIFNETLPKSNLSLQLALDKTIAAFNDDINRDAKKLLENTIDRASLDNFVGSVDAKISQALSNTHHLFTTNLASTEGRLDARISAIKQTTDGHLASTNALGDSVSTLLQKMENSSVKGALSENLLFGILHGLYPTAGIDHVGQQKETGDIIVTRPNKPKFLVENKNWTRNVSGDEVKKFIHDVETQKCSGVFLSQNCGIANKENYEINIHDGNVLIYVHEANNDPEKIKIAVDILDHFKLRLDELDTDVNTEVDTIPKDKLDAINNEVQYLVSSKLALVAMTREYSQKMLKHLDDIKIPTLETYLSSRYATSASKFVCEYCDFIAKNKAALGAHKRRCKSKPADASNVVIHVP